MQKITYYDRIIDGQAQLTTEPPVNKYAFDYLIVYKLIADDGYMLYNTAKKYVDKVALIATYDLPNWVEISFEEAKRLDK